MTDNGWIKVHRKIIDKGYYKRSQYVHLWIHILLKATHEETEFLWNKKIERLMPGQFITGRNSLSLETGIPASTIEDILNLLEREQQIRQQKNNKFRLLTVINWNGYQQVRQQKQQQADNKPTSTQQQADTFKNEKNFKNERKEEDIAAQEVLDYLNLKTGRNYKTFKEIIPRLGEGHTADEMKKIIDVKLLDPFFIEKPQYLNPETLFCKKHFDTYLNQQPEDFKNNGKKKPDCRTVSDDFSSDEKIMTERREKAKMKELMENATKGINVEDVTNV